MNRGRKSIKPTEIYSPARKPVMIKLKEEPNHAYSS